MKAQYGILRFKKYKGPAISPIEAHNERTKEQYASNPDIDTSRSHYNFHLVQPQGRYREETDRMIAAAHCRVRKDSVRVVEALVTASPEFFKDKTNREIRAYFAHTLKFLEGRQRPDTFLSAVIHMDEKTPHLHLCFVHLTLVGALREGEVAGLTPEDIDFDAADGMGTFTVNRSMQRVQKDTLAQVDKGCILRIFPDKLEGSKTSLILKDTTTEASCRTIFMTAALREEPNQWLERLKREEALDPERYRNIGMLLRLPNDLAVEPVLIRKKFLKCQDAHPEFPRIVFHGLRHSSATYQLMISGGDIKAVQGTTGHASADMLVNTYAHIQQSSRVELGKKFESGFYAKPDTSSPQAVPAAGEPTISMTALLELLKDADPEMKAKLRLALLT